MIGLHDIPKEESRIPFVIDSELFMALQSFKGHFPHLGLEILKQVDTPILFYWNDQHVLSMWTSANTRNWMIHRSLAGSRCGMCDGSTFTTDDMLIESGIRIVKEFIYG